MSAAPKLFLDANVILEIVEQRVHAPQAMKLVRGHPGSLCVSVLTVHLVMYFGLKIANVGALHSLLSDYEVLSLEPTDVEWAFEHMNGNDFEDALQLAVAVREGCAVFYTFDRRLYTTYGKLPYIQIKLLGARK